MHRTSAPSPGFSSLSPSRRWVCAPSRLGPFKAGPLAICCENPRESEGLKVTVLLKLRSKGGLRASFGSQTQPNRTNSARSRARLSLSTALTQGDRRPGCAWAPGFSSLSPSRRRVCAPSPGAPPQRGRHEPRFRGFGGRGLLRQGRRSPVRGARSPRKDVPPSAEVPEPGR